MNSKITALSPLATLQPDDVLPVVDVHDTSMASTGTTKKVTLAQVTGIGASNGSNDTAAIQALLTAARTAGGGYVRGTPGQHYRLGASLVIGSGTTLDMTGCTVTENAGTGDHMIANYSFMNPAGTALDGAVTSGSNVVTTSLGASAVAGQALVVAGAGGNGHGVLAGLVLSATATTITLGRLRDSQALKATATVSAASVKLYNRDSGIRITGGVWNLGANSPNPYPAILGYHVDNFTADIEGYTTAFGSGSRGIGVAGVRSFFIRAAGIATTSVGVQVSGPADGGRVDYVEGSSTVDDLLAITAGDYSANSGLMTGDITNVTIGTVKAVGTGGKLLNIIAGASWLVDGIKVTGALTGTGTSTLVYLGDDATDPGTIGGTYGEIDLGLIDAVSTGSAPLNLASPAADRITARIRHDNLISGVAVGISGTSTAVIGHLILSGSSAGANAGGIVYLNNSGVTVNELVLDGVLARNVPSGGWNGVSVDAGTIGEVSFRDCRFEFTGQSQYALLVGGGTVGRARFAGGYYAGGAHLVNTHGQTGPLRLVLDGCQVTGFGRLAQISTATTAVLSGVMADSQSFELFYLADTSTLVLMGNLASGPANGLIARAAAQAIRVASAQLQADLSLLTPAEGDLCYNTNAALSCGTGVAVHHTSGTGNGWKNLYSGLTY